MPAVNIEGQESSFQIFSKKNHSIHANAAPPGQNTIHSRGLVEARGIFVIRLIQKLLDQAEDVIFNQRNRPILCTRTHIGFDVQDINQRLIIPFDFIHQPWGYY